MVSNPPLSVRYLAILIAKPVTALQSRLIKFQVQPNKTNVGRSFEANETHLERSYSLGPCVTLKERRIRCCRSSSYNLQIPHPSPLPLSMFCFSFSPCSLSPSLSFQSSPCPPPTEIMSQTIIASRSSYNKWRNE